jgi:hypothetical protein
MKKAELKDIISAWEIGISKVKIKQKLKKKMYNLTQKELVDMIDSIEEFYSLSNEEKECFDWMDVEIKSIINKQDIINSTIETLIMWFFYLTFYERCQGYEMCIKIRDVIAIELDETSRMIETYFIIEEEDVEIIQGIREKCKQEVYDNYDEWLKIIHND